MLFRSGERMPNCVTILAAIPAERRKCSSRPPIRGTAAKAARRNWQAALDRLSLALWAYRRNAIHSGRSIRFHASRDAAWA